MRALALKINRTKKSGIYPEVWSECVCDLKALEAIMSDQAKFTLNNGVFEIESWTNDGLSIQIYYDISTKRIKTHYPILD